MKSALFFLLMLCFISNAYAQEDMIVVLETNQGMIEIKLMPDIAPKACENFTTLVEQGYYNGIIFHRIIKNFMIQGGDPTGTGRGGNSTWGEPFEDEVKADIKFDKPGLLAMANAGPNTNGSQFFITHTATPHLDGNHTVFGETTKGQDVINSITGGDKIEGITIHGDTTALFESQADRIADWNSVLG